MKRRLVIFGAVVGMVALGVGVFRLFVYRPCFNREDFERIQVGMSLSELEEILGVPAGDYSTNSRAKRVYAVPLPHRARPVICSNSVMLVNPPDSWTAYLLDFTKARHELSPQATRKTWVSDTSMIDIWLDSQNRVTFKDVWSVRLKPETLFDKLSRWLKF